jgi:catalase
VIFDAVVVIVGDDATALVAAPSARQWIADAFAHCKVIGFTRGAKPLLDAARVESDAGVLAIDNAKAIAAFIETAKRGRIWSREAEQADKPDPPRKRRKK